MLLGDPSGGNNTLFPGKFRYMEHTGGKRVPIELRRAEISVKKIFSSIVFMKSCEKIPFASEKPSQMVHFLRTNINFYAVLGISSLKIEFFLTPHRFEFLGTKLCT